MFESILKKKQAAVKIIPYTPAPTPMTQESGNEMWDKCPSCHTVLYIDDLVANLRVCQRCGCHFRLNAMQRILLTADEGSFEQMDERVAGTNPLRFPGYEEKLKTARSYTGLTEAIVTGRCAIGGHETVIAAMDPGFMMGSMGGAVGEKMTRAVEKAIEWGLPLIAFTVSGGARMQEGLISLMQMAKVSGALARLAERKLPYIVVLTDPTTGGVTASFAMLGDVTLAEPGALVGFAGRRVIEQTVKQTLPPGFQTAEFLLQKGFIDAIVHRKDLRAMLERLLGIHAKGGVLRHSQEDACVASETGAVSALTPWERVKLARDPSRPATLSLAPHIFDNIVELKGDRLFADDAAIVGSIATLDGLPVTVIGHEKGKSVQDKAARNFGCAHPEGYRKSLRLMEQAEKFGRPVICFIDTQGAYCGLGAEERGIGAAIAENLAFMMGLSVPVLAVFVGEGGSGGALALGVANRCAMLENAVYSILSPEGFASILWKDSSRAEEAAGVMRMTAEDAQALGVVEDVLPEPPGGAQCDAAATAATIKAWLVKNLAELTAMDKETLKAQRYDRFRAFGSAE